MTQNPKITGKLQDNANTGLLDDVVITRDCMLDGTVAIAQPKSGFRVGTDAVFLAASVGSKSRAHSGSGRRGWWG